jgi:hypothetical protein
MGYDRSDESEPEADGLERVDLADKVQAGIDAMPLPEELKEFALGLFGAISCRIRCEIQLEYLVLDALKVSFVNRRERRVAIVFVKQANPRLVFCRGNPDDEMTPFGILTNCKKVVERLIEWVSGFDDDDTDLGL